MKKKCNECGILKDPEQFGKQKAQDDGLYQKCILCCRTRGKAINSRKGSGDGYAASVLASLRDSDEHRGVSGRDD